MSLITISAEEYTKLQQQAAAYRELTGHFFSFVLHDPVRDTVEDFRKTNLYTEDFISDMEEGLRKSSYAKSKK